MVQFAVEDQVKGEDIKRVRKKLALTQKEFSRLVNVSQKTIERWESGEKTITGPITVLCRLLEDDPEITHRLEIPEMPFPLRLFYMHDNQICTIIDVNERDRNLRIYNYRRDYMYRAFGREEHPSYEQYEAFLESRCFPRQRDKMKIILREWNLPFYDPMLIIGKTQGRMAEDNFWIKVERKYNSSNVFDRT